MHLSAVALDGRGEGRMRELGRAEDGRDDHWRLLEVLVEEVDPHLAAAADEGAGNCRTVLPQLALFGDLHLNVLLRAAVMAATRPACMTAKLEHTCLNWRHKLL